MPRAFISLAASDREFVETHLVSTLRANGIGTWYCREEIAGAAEWEREILSGLIACDWFLVAMSPRAATSQWVMDEVHWAMSHRLSRIVPVMIAACDPLAFHLRMPRIQYVNFCHPSRIAQRRLLEAFREAHAPDVIANLDIQVLRKRSRFWLTQALPVADLLPVRDGDLVRIEVSVDRPAYLYVFWLIGNREILPLFPWLHGRWDQRPASESAVARLDLPSGDSSTGWPVQQDSHGLETVFVMVRATPLPHGINLEWLPSELPSEDDALDPCLNVTFDSKRAPPARGIDLGHPQRVTETPLRIHEALLKRFAGQCSLLLASTFVSSHQ